MVSEEIREFVSSRPIVVLASVSKAGVPNVAPMGWKVWHDERTLLILDNYMNSTRSNIRETGKASVSVWNPDTGEAYQLKGSAEYAESGKYMTAGAEHMSAQKPGARPKGVVALHVEEVYDQKPGEHAGRMIQSGLGL